VNNNNFDSQKGAMVQGVYLVSNKQKYWFPAKRYGWGWGLPSSWQGWVVFVIYFSLLGLGTLLLRPWGLVAYLVFVGFINALLATVCWLKGEPPRWRWGKH